MMLMLVGTNAITKEFSSEIQFITHNKRTMGMSNILYGVTIEECDIPKIMSVKINKQELRNCVVCVW
ncbi:MAG: hypothetical protein LBS15_01850 [Endomicrobium sp.]|jgi:chromosome segregation protein|nr:hypothetical protein [Endomicrobium sp.]